MKYEKILKGDLIIKKGCTDDLSHIVEITGSLETYIDIKLPLLEKVGGSVRAYEGAKFSLPQLTSCGDSVRAYEGAELSLPQLTSCGGSVRAYEGSKLSLPQLTSCGDSVRAYGGAKLSIKNGCKQKDKNAKQFTFEFNFNCFLKVGMLFADGILAQILKKRANKNGTTIYKIQIAGQTKVSYCIESGGKFAHADTIEQAKEDLKYKFANIDKSKYQNYTLDTVVSFKDAIQMYHDITGACSGGTKHFCENVLTVKKQKYSIKECIELTKGQYGSETFKEFFKK